VRAIQALKAMSKVALRAKGLTAREVLERTLSQDMLCGAFCDRLERAFASA
jgi:hypothetical protein